MVGWFGAAALALVGGLKGQGNPWRQIPLVGVLAATALFISWSVRHSREKDTSKVASPDDNTVAEVNTRVYLVYDEEKKLECSTSQSPPTSSEREFENLTDTDSGGSTSVEVEDIAENSQGQNSESENRKGGESWSRTVNVSRGDSECKDVDGISKAETTIHDVKASASKPVPSPASKITDVSVSGLVLPQIKNQKVLVNPEIPSVVEKEEPFISFESVTGSLKGEIDDSLSDCPVGDVLHHHEDVFPVMDSDVTSNKPQQDELSSDSKHIILGQMERLEKVLNVVKPYKDSVLTTSENGMGALSNKLQEIRQVPAHSLQVFASNNSSTLTHALDKSGLRKDNAAADRESSTLREIRATWISQELQFNDRVSSRGDSELGYGRLAHPAPVTESYPSAVAESVTGTFPFSDNSTSESRDSDVMDCKDKFRLQSPPSNVKRIISHVKDLEPDSRKSSEEQYAERLRVYDEYLGDPSLSPTMRSQVVRAKATLERLLYDSD